MEPAGNGFGRVDYFLRAGPETIGSWVQRREARLGWFCAGAVVVGSGAYGAVIGCWWSPLQGLYVAIKLPVLILLTALGNGLLNGTLAPLLGLNMTFKQSLTAVLVSFAYTSLVLGGLSPVALFVVWNAPGSAVAGSIAGPEHALLQLVLVAFIAFAGVLGNFRLLPLLQQMGSRGAARRVLLAWLAGNLFLGSQICWVLRPYIWAGNPVPFIGRNNFQGNFYETVFEAIRKVLG